MNAKDNTTLTATLFTALYRCRRCVPQREWVGAGTCGVCTAALPGQTGASPPWPPQSPPSHPGFHQPHYCQRHLLHRPGGCDVRCVLCVFALCLFVFGELCCVEAPCVLFSGSCDSFFQL